MTCDLCVSVTCAAVEMQFCEFCGRVLSLAPPLVAVCDKGCAGEAGVVIQLLIIIVEVEDLGVGTNSERSWTFVWCVIGW